MGVLEVTWLREVRAYRHSVSALLTISAFLAVTGWTFVVILNQGEGSALQLQTIWGLSVSAWLAVFSVLLTVGLFSRERSSGMVDLLLSAPVRERSLVQGKFCAVMTVVAAALFISLILPKVILPLFMPAADEQFQVLPFLLTYCFLMVQASTCCSAGMMISAFSKNEATAALSSFVLCCGLPVALYLFTLFWIPPLRAELASFPLIVHVYDVSTGLLSAGTVAGYLFATAFFLFVCTKRLEWIRLRG